MNLAADNYFAVVPEWIIVADISDRAFRLWAVLYRQSDKATGYARISRPKLALRLRTSVKSIDRALRELEVAGAVTVRSRWSNGDKVNPSYSFVRDAVHSVPAPNGYILRTARPNGGVTDAATPLIDVDPDPESATPVGGSVTGVPTSETPVTPSVATPVTPGVGTPVTHVLREVVPVVKDLSSATPPRNESVEPPRADVEALCERLVDRMIDNGSKPPRITDAWRREARLLLDRDGRDLDKALRLIDWCQQDSFWRANIHSMATFRRQYDALRLKANRSIGAPSAGRGVGRAWQE